MSVWHGGRWDCCGSGGVRLPRLHIPLYRSADPTARGSPRRTCGWSCGGKIEDGMVDKERYYVSMSDNSMTIMPF